MRRRVNNQKDAVLKYITKYGSITHRQASRKLGVDRLAARVADINDILLSKEEKVVAYGWAEYWGRYLVADYEYVTNRYGQKTRIARYRFNA